MLRFYVTGAVAINSKRSGTPPGSKSYNVIIKSQLGEKKNYFEIMCFFIRLFIASERLETDAENY